jgi:hypothetical protein
VAAAANGVFFQHGADTAGLHDLAVFLIAVTVLLLAVTLTDRSLARLGSRARRAPPQKARPADDHPRPAPRRCRRPTDLARGRIAARSRSRRPAR